MPGEESIGKVYQVTDDFVAGVSPVAGEFEAVAGSFTFFAGCFDSLLDVLVPGGVGIVFRTGPVGDDEDLDILIESGGSPEAVPLVAFDLIEGFPNGDASSL